jgi:hypothetical protein
MRQRQREQFGVAVQHTDAREGKIKATNSRKNERGRKPQTKAENIEIKIEAKDQKKIRKEQKRGIKSRKNLPALAAKTREPKLVSPTL